jgi:6-pyruvoyltetrahydropterin/6-carboxytetrahydropterin synthase
MHRLTRTVRFAINSDPDGQLAQSPSNSYAGYPSLTGAGQFFELAATVEGPLQPPGDYLLNIKQIDQQVRALVIPIFMDDLSQGKFASGVGTLQRSAAALANAWPNVSLVRLRLSLTPYCSLTLDISEAPMVRVSQKFEFCASHRLHNPTLSDEENRRIFGKCNNPRGHGHNYELEVTLIGNADGNGRLMSMMEIERIVSETVIEKFDHKNLNCELDEFRDINPSVENISRVIFEMLKPRFGGHFQGPSLAAVTVWETPKTFCEYSEDVPYRAQNAR